MNENNVYIFKKNLVLPDCSKIIELGFLTVKKKKKYVEIFHRGVKWLCISKLVSINSYSQNKIVAHT